MNILVTGACGFIGSHLAEHFLASGHRVVGIDNLSTGRLENFPDDLAAELVEGDIANRRELAFAFALAQPDVVYHCAASYADRDAWERDARTNVLGTIEVLRLCAEYEVRRLVYFQTSLCYGLAPESPVKPDAPIDPTSSYAISKTAAEQYIAMSGIDYASLRLANIYGPRNLSGPVPTFFRRIQRGEPCTIVDTRRDFVFVGDLVDIAARMAEPEAPGGVWHVGSGHDEAILTMFDAVVEAMGADVEPVPVIPRGPDDAFTILVDPTLTEQAFGWSAKTPLQQGIEAAVAWYEAHGVEQTFTHLAIKG